MMSVYCLLPLPGLLRLAVDSASSCRGLQVSALAKCQIRELLGSSKTRWFLSPAALPAALLVLPVLLPAPRAAPWTVASQISGSIGAFLELVLSPSDRACSWYPEPVAQGAVSAMSLFGYRKAVQMLAGCLQPPSRPGRQCPQRGPSKQGKPPALPIRPGSEKLRDQGPHSTIVAG